MPGFEVQRSIEIAASPEQVFETLVDYHTWSHWSPWLCAEPDAQVNVSEDSRAVGATYAWDGELVGSGQLTHLQIKPGRQIDDEIEFLKPYRSKSSVQFQLDPLKNDTLVTWRMDGSLPWHLFWMRSRIQAYVGLDYERGLKMLKQWVEVVVHGVQPIGPLNVAGVGRSCAFSDVGPVMSDAISAATTLLADQGLPNDGLPISVYHSFKVSAEALEFTIGRVLPGSIGVDSSEFSIWSIPTMRALRVEHIGAYQNLGNAWYTAMQIARHRKLKLSWVGPFEIYRNDPNDTPEPELRTDVYLPLK
jgi:effector-binding domain-containing protein/uncharacterized protein YndB with AHSA1/START domain